MQLKNIVFAASLAATAAAAPTAESKTFNVISIHSGSAVQYAGFNAAKSSILAGLPSQNASCARPEEQTATFYINHGALYLYDQSATPQEIFVDRSGMGKSDSLDICLVPSLTQQSLNRPGQDWIHDGCPACTQELRARRVGY